MTETATMQATATATANDIEAIAASLKIVNVAAFKTGYDDGFEQGFELSMGMSYDDDVSQYAYDIGTHIGACEAVRPKE